MIVKTDPLFFGHILDPVFYRLETLQHLHDFLHRHSEIHTDLVKIILCPPLHLYYGRTIHIEHPDDLEILVEKHVFAPGNVNICEKEHAGFSLEDVRLEMSSYGKGDIREPFVEAIL